jgi:lysophospholipase L1-like esterase
VTLTRFPRHRCRFAPFVATLVALSCLARPSRAADAPAFELRDGDRVAFVGNTFFEREVTHGYIETMLTTRFPDRNVTFRNIGWSGDTVFGTARAYFDEPDKGFERLKRHAAEVKPTVLFVCYGMSESFDGPAGLEGFVKGYDRLLDMLKEQSAPDARFVLISPIRHETLGEPYPDPAMHNAALKLYTDAIARIAAERGARFIDLFTKLIPPDPVPRGPFTDNGIHLSPVGYHTAAFVLDQELFGLRKWRLTLDAGGKVVSATRVRDAKAAPADGGLRITFTPDTLPLPRDPKPARFPAANLCVYGLSPGNWSLRTADGATVVSKQEAKAWENGVTLDQAGPSVDHGEQLRQLVVQKNVQYFNKYRPANETYIFLFRNQEQGRNAAEIPQFDGPIAEIESEIAKLRTPEAMTYTLVKE